MDLPLNGLPPGAYALRGGMYRRPGVQRVPAVDGAGALRDGEFGLGDVTIGAPPA
jgi:hypothetical protein